MVGMHIMTMVNIVMIELNVVGVALGSVFKSKLLAILDVVLKLAVVHDESFWFICHVLFVLAVG